jgi:mono/diheme cytochrome c family protein
MSAIISRRRVPFLAIVIALVGGTVWLLWPSGPSGRADPDNTQQVALGLTVYQKYCASCHGAKLEGQPNWRMRKPDGKLPTPPHDKSGHSWHHPDEQLFLLTKKGLRPPLAPDGYKSDMPAFGNILTDAEIWAVLAFIKHSWPPDIQARQRQLDAASRSRR